MERESIWTKIFMVIGFFVVSSLLMSIVSSIFIIIIIILIPVAIILWFLRFISGNTNRNHYR